MDGAGSKLFPARTAPPDGTTFAQITFGDKTDGEIPAFGYWNVQFYHPRAAYVRFNYDFPRGASIAVYGRRNALPTHTQYEILELLNGFTSRQIRSAHVRLSIITLVYRHGFVFKRDSASRVTCRRESRYYVLLFKLRVEGIIF